MTKPPQKLPEKNAKKSSKQPDPLEAEIGRQIGDLIPQGSRQEIISRVTTIIASEHFAGPIPHPRHLRGYEEIQPGAADRIIAMAETQQNHHIAMDNKFADAEIADRKLGMYLGAGTFALLVFGAFFSAILTDSDVVPGLFLGAAALGGVALFVKGRTNGD